MTYTRVQCKSTTRFAATIMLALGVLQAKKAAVSSFGVSVRHSQHPQHQRTLVHATKTTTVLYSTPLDEQGRRVRNRPEYEEQDNSNDGGWDGFDPLATPSSDNRRASSSSSSNSNSNSNSNFNYSAAESMQVLVRVRTLNDKELHDQNDSVVQVQHPNSLSVSSFDGKKTFQCAYDSGSVLS